MKKITIIPTIIFVLLIMMAPVYAATYKYDDLNRLTDVIYESGKRIHYTYDAAGNMLTMVVNSQEVKNIAVDSSGYTLKVGETHKTVVSAVYSDDTASIITDGITFASSDVSVASVDSVGTVKGLKAGTAEITAIYKDKTAIIKVDVVQTEMLVRGYVDSPSNNTTIKGNYSVHGWVLDPNGVSKVEILVDSNVVGQAVYGDTRKDVSKSYPDYKNDNSGFHFNLDTQKLTDGKHTLTVTETGNSGISTTIGTKTINVYNMPPKGFLDSPKNNSLISGEYRINGWFLDNAGVEKIEVMVDDEVIGKAVYGTLRSDVLKVYPQYKNENCGYYFDLDTTKIIEGKHKIKICETGKNGTQTMLPVVDVIVSKLPVRGYIDRPALKEPVSGIYKIRGWIQDSSGVEKIEALVDNTLVGEVVYGDLRKDVSKVYPEYNNPNSGFHFNLDTTNLSDGTHTLKIRETGRNTGVTSIEKNIIVSRLPVKGFVQNIGSITPDRGIVNIMGWLLDSSGVSKVEITVDGAVVGEASYGDTRPEVFSKYPEYGNENAGFHYDLDASKLTEGSHKVRILETGKNGGQTELPQIFSYLDAPKTEKPISGISKVSGWCIDSTGIEKIEVLIDNIVVGEAVYGDSRLDVFKEYPNFNNKNSGFHYDLDTSELTVGDHSITIKYHSQFGEVNYLNERQITVVR